MFAGTAGGEVEQHRALGHEVRVSDLYADGFDPVASAADSAAASLRTTWLIGKFHGVKAATGPTGSFTTSWRTAGLRLGTMRP